MIETTLCPICKGARGIWDREGLCDSEPKRWLQCRRCGGTGAIPEINNLPFVWIRPDGVMEKMRPSEIDALVSAGWSLREIQEYRPGLLEFTDLRAAQVSRCEKHFHACDDWSPTDWACALAGEVGELCNLIKKQRRGEDIEPGAMARELADVIAYADLLAHRLGIDLAQAVRNKFNEVSVRIGAEEML